MPVIFMQSFLYVTLLYFLLSFQIVFAYSVSLIGAKCVFFSFFRCCKNAKNASSAHLLQKRPACFSLGSVISKIFKFFSKVSSLTFVNHSTNNTYLLSLKNSQIQHITKIGTYVTFSLHLLLHISLPIPVSTRITEAEPKS